MNGNQDSPAPRGHDAQRLQGTPRDADLSAYVRALPPPDPQMMAYAPSFLSELEQIPVYRPTVGCVIPCYNEEATIGAVLDSLLNQTRLPDVIHVVVNNTTDDTVEVASHYAGLHVRTDKTGNEQTCEIFVHDIGENPDKKVGALNYGYSLVEGCDYLLGVDGDTTAEPNAVQSLVDEIASDDRIGGISAIYSIDDSALSNPMAKFLIAGQRAQFAAFNMQNLLRGRNMAVLGGQFSIFSTQALRDVVNRTHQRYPWVRDSEVEDSLLSLEIKSAGYLTKISAVARAHVGGMTTLRSLDAQQVKWNFGAIELMWPGQRGDTKGQPFHPNLRLRWFEQASMVTNLLTRTLFFMLLGGSLSISAFVFNPLWLIPPTVATILNYRVAKSMHYANKRDYAFALFIPFAEAYMWIRLGHFVRSWAKFASRTQTDNWAAQAKAERGAGNSHWTPVIVLVVFLGVMAAVWTQLSITTKSDILAVGWPILGAITIAQTAWMMLKILRRYKGFKA
ncbi:glycosyltransferase family 2 protein [Nocardioides massiliensis]|uniref:Cellulose synthase/poly-beta-1,6-N-acetylglucosamine synthase-like glycosyltransferase n=1 Tax=Nocardioides massiliensis TaxID=1325935 RepID=A0ABT9NWL0_9ACTN|nr:glycosyltransferase [Nocardioides massiliensis]MDP9824225.1 cellulose synthase/poly-beta-1,6-N-acetylglucosamine synthase-like glycosyltransferase [Nocardioides massiliensis]